MGLALPLGAEEKLPPLEVIVDKQKVDLENGRLEVKLSRPAARVTLKVLGQSGAVVAQVDQAFSGTAAGAPLVVMWTVKSGDPVARIEVYGYDTQGYYKGVAITPWSFQVPHQEVIFETNSAVIRKSEEQKLKNSMSTMRGLIKRHASLGAITLYVAAHTDTVGTGDYNRKLSTRRAQAIARWFRRHGLKIPIAFDGLGETVLKVATKDEVAESRNRRVDYSLALEPPRFKNSGVSPRWRGL